MKTASVRQEHRMTMARGNSAVRLTFDNRGFLRLSRQSSSNAPHASSVGTSIAKNNWGRVVARAFFPGLWHLPFTGKRVVQAVHNGEKNNKYLPPFSQVPRDTPPDAATMKAPFESFCQLKQIGKLLQQQFNKPPDGRVFPDMFCGKYFAFSFG